MGEMDEMSGMNDRKHLDIQILRQAAGWGTPAYVFDLDAFALRIRHMKEILGQDIKIIYAMKANPFFTRTAAQEADGLEVCSPANMPYARGPVCPRRRLYSPALIRRRLISGRLWAVSEVVARLSETPALPPEAPALTPILPNP